MFRLHLRQWIGPRFSIISLYIWRDPKNRGSTGSFLRQTWGNCKCFSEFLSWLIMLSRIGTTLSHESGGTGSNIGLRCASTRLRSICSIEMEWRSEANPEPLMLMQLVRRNLLTFCAASMCNSILLISSSVSLAASSFSMSPKSRVCQSLPAID